MSLSKSVIALDNMEREQMRTFLSKIKGKVPMVKIGMELFYRHGEDILREVHESFGFEIFLDLKLHDIPHTVARAILSLGKRLEGIPLKFLTVHLSGGESMLKTAVKQAEKSLPDTSLLGVGILTSLDEKDIHSLWRMDKSEDLFVRLSRLVFDCRLPGMILSAMELPLVKKIEKDRGLIVKVCPGIRFSDESTHDQKRTMTPQQALKAGADYIVLGRTLTSYRNVEERLEQLSCIEAT